MFVVPNLLTMTNRGGHSRGVQYIAWSFFSFGACLLCLLGCVQLYKMGCGKLKSEKGEKNASGRVFFLAGTKASHFWL